MCPRPPRAQALSPNACAESVRQLRAASIVGTGCQEWLLSAAGVEWSPVTTSTSGLRAVMRGHERVDLLDHLHLGPEVAVLAAAVGVLDVHVEEVVVRPVPLQGGELFRDRGAGVQASSMPTSMATPRYIG